MDVLPVTVGSRDRSLRVDAGGEGAHRARSIENGEGTVAGAQELVNCGAALIRSRNLPRPVNGCDPGARPERVALRARRIEGGDGTVRRAQEAVQHKVRVIVAPRDRANPVNALRESVGGARSIEGDEAAVRSTQEAVEHKVRVIVAPRDRSLRVDARGVGGGRARRIEDDKGNFLSICGMDHPQRVQHHQANGEHFLPSSQQEPLGDGERICDHRKLLFAVVRTPPRLAIIWIPLGANPGVH